MCWLRAKNNIIIIILVHIWKSIFYRFEHEGRLWAIKAYIYAGSISDRGTLKERIFHQLINDLYMHTPSNTHTINQGESALKQVKVMWPSKSNPKMQRLLTYITDFALLCFCFVRIFDIKLFHMCLMTSRTNCIRSRRR